MLVFNLEPPVKVRFYEQILDTDGVNRHFEIFAEFIARGVYTRTMRSGPYIVNRRICREYQGHTASFSHMIFMLEEDACDEYDARMKETNDETGIQAQADQATTEDGSG